jgi:hypothetical protein
LCHSHIIGVVLNLEVPSFTMCHIGSQDCHTVTKGH